MPNIRINFVDPGLTKCILVNSCFCLKIDWRKARKRELAIFDENRRAVGMLNPTRNKIIKARTGGEKGGHLPVTCDHGLSRRSLVDGKNLP